MSSWSPLAARSTPTASGRVHRTVDRLHELARGPRAAHRVVARAILAGRGRTAAPSPGSERPSIVIAIAFRIVVHGHARTHGVELPLAHDGAAADG